MSKPISPQHTAKSKAPSLEQLLRRKDVWYGHSQAFVEQAHWSSGHTALDQALLHGGWPLSSLVEICQAQNCQTEWLLLGPAIRQACAQGGYTVLVNPPLQPYGPALIQQNIDLNQLILVQTKNKQDFIASVIEVLRAPVCPLLLSWEPAQALNYAELRKCQLATAEHPGLSLLFRKQRQQQQSSPAGLRLSSRLQAEFLELEIFKQRGKLHKAWVQIPLPESWQALPAHPQLHPQSHPGASKQQPVQTLPTATLLAFANPQAEAEHKP